MRRTETHTTTTAAHGALRFSARNWMILLIGLIAILGGYFLLAGGSTIAAPLLLVLGYVVLLPLGIIL